MSHVAVGQAGAHATAGVSDLDIAEAVASAALATPAVLALSAGLAAQAATYGPERRRVVGVVVRRPPLADDAEGAVGDMPAAPTVIEVHVTLSAAACDAAWAAWAARESAARARARKANAESHDGEPVPPAILLSIADHIRVATRTAAQTVAPATPIQIDVFLDDVR